MAKARTPSKRTALASYTVESISKSIKVGDCILLRPAESSNQPYVAKVEKIEADGKGHVTMRVRWYYRPEESIGGRRPFHGSKELFLSDHYDIQSADTIEGKCVVHSFKSYVKLDSVGNEDYFCRFEYNSTTGAFNPDRVAVFCKCEMPYNPDDLMVQCEGCDDWFHPSCIQMDAEEIEKVEHFFCHECSAEEKKSNHTAPKISDTKMPSCARSQEMEKIPGKSFHSFTAQGDNHISHFDQETFGFLPAEHSLFRNDEALKSNTM